MTKAEMIAAENARHEQAMNHCNEVDDFLMQQYYDCQDDYALAGLSAQANKYTKDIETRRHSIRLEEIENGFHIEKSNVLVLTDEDGIVVAEGVRHGQYGYYFTTPEGYVGLPSRLNTLLKKGYSLFIRERVYECVLKDIRKGKVINSSMKIASEIFHEIKTPNLSLTELPLVDSWSDYFYSTNFAA